jgi:hypothetical protein
MVDVTDQWIPGAGHRHAGRRPFRFRRSETRQRPAVQHAPRLHGALLMQIGGAFDRDKQPGR